MSEENAYKVVWEDEDGTYYSACIARGPYKLQYLLGARTEAPCGSTGICCFATLEAARQFVRGYVFHRLKIVEVKPDGPPMRAKLLYSTSILEDYAPEAASHFIAKALRGEWGWSGPYGTVVYSAITPLRVIQ